MNGVGVTKYSKIVWSTLVFLLFSLSVSVGFNIYLFIEVSKREDVGDASRPIEGHFSEMWNAFSIRITPDRAALSIEQDRCFNVSVTALYWAPLQFELRAFHFKIYDTFWEPPKLLDEKTMIVDKSRDDLDYRILFNFTANLDVCGTRVYTLVGAPWENVTLDRRDCWVSFALNIGE